MKRGRKVLRRSGEEWPLIAASSAELKAALSEREREQLAASDQCRHPADPAREVRNSTAGTLFCTTSKKRLKIENGCLKLRLEFEYGSTSAV